MMRKSIFLLTLFLIEGKCFSQKNKLKKNPPGTVQINDSLYVDRTEVANVHYREYLYWLSKYDSLKYEKMLPDTTVWNEPLILNENPKTQFYFRHPGFNNYPVVGVSYEQATEFCKWRSEMVNELYSKLPEKERAFKKVTYRLPTIKEWEIIASKNFNIEIFPFGYDSTYKLWKGKYRPLFNCLYNNEPVIGKERFFYTSPVGSYFKNAAGTYNMIGNVAEMVAEKGVSKGGSFLHLLNDCKISAFQNYSKAEQGLGFRCVAIIEK